ncbi:MAG: pyroglutamyl-peptidase [Pseudonocardiales bacterium]|jgi:pyroglutamyl-peptidase|nr:pyroglutamyl-peptidase [Pseudonocardiales bacterium]
MDSAANRVGQHTVLVTGFGPFGRHTRNPSAELALALDGSVISGANVVARLFETSTETVAAELAQALDELSPSLLICLGLAAGRPALSLERVAVNVRDFPLPDHAGAIVVDEPVLTDGPAAIFSGLPVKAILRQWQKDAVPGHVSNTAGTYLCNQLFYLACAQGLDRDIAAGFVHIPDTPESAAASLTDGAVPGPTMSIDVMVRALTSAIATCLQHDGSKVVLSAGAMA